MGHAVILTGAVRDEGTSFHYLPAGRVVSADPGPVESLGRTQALSARGLTGVSSGTYPGIVQQRLDHKDLSTTQIYQGEVRDTEDVALAAINW